MEQPEVPAGIETIDVLRSLGFFELQDGFEGHLTFNFGNFKPTVFRSINRWFVDVVHVMGLMHRPHGTITLVESQIPAVVSSRQEAMGWLAYVLDDNAGGEFQPLCAVPWLAEAREHTNLVPMVRDRIEYARQQAIIRALPHCYVERPYLRVALTSLRNEALAATSDRVVSIVFDGRVLSFNSSMNRHQLVAEGPSWPETVVVSLTAFALQSRLYQSYVVVRVFESHLAIGEFQFDRVQQVAVAKQS